MRTAETILKANFGEYMGQEGFINKMKSAINEARIEAIEECAEVAKATADYHRGKFTGEAYVDKQSILNLINSIK